MTAKLDENRIPTAQGVSNADGTTVINVCAVDADHSLCIDDGLGGSDLGPTGRDLRDGNYKVAFMAVSAVDGVTPVAVYVDSATNKLLIRTS